jgi:hypothetical protein
MTNARTSEWLPGPRGAAATQATAEQGRLGTRTPYRTECLVRGETLPVDLPLRGPCRPTLVEGLVPFEPAGRYQGGDHLSMALHRDRLGRRAGRETAG